MALPEGVYYFGTISDSKDYTPSEKMIALLQSKFITLHMVEEKGSQNGKIHLHFVGNSVSRLDNLKRSITTLLDREGYEITPYTLDLRTEVKPKWRIGYLEKDFWSKIIYSTWPKHFLVECSQEYEARPKKERNHVEDSVFTMKKFEEYINENEIRTVTDLRNAIDALREDGRMSMSFYCKLNMKRLIAWVERNYCDV